MIMAIIDKILNELIPFVFFTHFRQQSEMSAVTKKRRLDDDSAPNVGDGKLIDFFKIWLYQKAVRLRFFISMIHFGSELKRQIIHSFFIHSNAPTLKRMI